MAVLAASGITKWHKINSRQANSLLTAEFLHYLHERHSPFVNPHRISSTVVEFRPWRVTSYAPKRDWDTMVRRARDSFLAEPLERCRLLDESLNRPRAATAALLRELHAADLAQVSFEKLVDLLANSMFVPLGDIFEINLVQVEAAIESALRKLVAKDAFLSESRSAQLISELVTSSEPTVLVSEEIEFVSLVLELLDADREAIEAGLERRLEIYPELTAAYGGREPSLKDLIHRFEQYAGRGREELERTVSDSRHREIPDARGAGADLPDEARPLSSSLRRLGEVRDTNKALLGRVTVFREAIVREIGLRRDVPLRELRLYSLEELCSLGVEGTRVAPPVVDLRRSCGVVYERRAELRVLDRSVDTGPEGERTTFHGIPASGGVYSGRAYVVEDAGVGISGMRLGDVLVAEGTDFDLGLLLTMAGAVVTEEGGMLSHAAVVAREKGIPCLIQVPGATRGVQTGDRLEVDSDEGVARLIGGEEDAGAVPRPTQGLENRGVDELLAVADSDDPSRYGHKSANLKLLSELGMPVPPGTLVVPSEQVSHVRGLGAEERKDHLSLIAARILGAFETDTLCLRSSGVYEDLESDTAAAGIYESAIRVPARPSEVVQALETVIESGSAPRVRAYFEGRLDADPNRMAVMVTAFTECSVQGTATYPSGWTDGHAAVEFGEQSRDGSDFRACQLVEARPEHTRAPRSAIDAPGAAARYAKQLSDHWGGACVEIEWGLTDEGFVIFQGRRVQTFRGGPAGETAVRAETGGPTTGRDQT
jgi:phosphohistidine swiveling domain-containing protein